jgi:hypothetical protein
VILRSQKAMAPRATAGSAPGDGSMLAEVAQVDHRIGQGFECIMQPAETFEPEQQAADLSSQPNTRSMVLNCFLKISASNNGLRSRLADFRPLGLGLMFGTIPRLKIAFRLRWQS